MMVDHPWQTNDDSPFRKNNLPDFRLVSTETILAKNA
jgi:hypothetical protein